jgi:hypothetical protein
VPGFLKGALLYFAVVFGAGFLLGTVRILIVVPYLGTRAAELIELPVMLMVTIVSAKCLVQWLSIKSGLHRLTMGSVALILLLFAEFTFVLWVRGLTIKTYFATQDPVSGTVYLITLVLFALMPLLFRQAHHDSLH